MGYSLPLSESISLKAFETAQGQTSTSGQAPDGSVPPVLALLYDVHGNLPALEAVLADARAAERGVSSSAATMRCSGPGRARRSSVCAGSMRNGSAATWTAGPQRRPTPPRRSRTRSRAAELLGEPLVSRPRCPSRLPASACSTATPRRSRTCAASPRRRRMTTWSCSPAPTRRGWSSATPTSRSGVRAPGGVDLVNPGSVGLPAGRGSARRVRRRARRRRARAAAGGLRPRRGGAGRARAARRRRRAAGTRIEQARFDVI